MSTNIIGCFTQNPNRPSRAASVRYTGLGSRSTGSCCGTRVPVYIGCQMGHFPARHVSCQPMGVFKLHALRCEMVGVVLVCWSIWWKTNVGCSFSHVFVCHMLCVGETAVLLLTRHHFLLVPVPRSFLTFHFLSTPAFCSNVMCAGHTTTCCCSLKPWFCKEITYFLGTTNVELFSAG